MIIVKGKASWLFSIRAWTVNHLGRNPKKGGNPPREKKFKIRANLVIGVICSMIICFKKKILNKFRIKTIFAVIIV